MVEGEEVVGGVEVEGGVGGGVQRGEKEPVAEPGLRKNRLSDSNASKLNPQVKSPTSSHNKRMRRSRKGEGKKKQSSTSQFLANSQFESYRSLPMSTTRD